MTILLVFVLCWLPLNLINLMEDLDLQLHCWRSVSLLLLALGYSSHNCHWTNLAKLYFTFWCQIAEIVAMI